MTGVERGGRTRKTVRRAKRCLGRVRTLRFAIEGYISTPPSPPTQGIFRNKWVPVRRRAKLNPRVIPTRHRLSTAGTKREELCAHHMTKRVCGCTYAFFVSLRTGSTVQQCYSLYKATTYCLMIFERSRLAQAHYAYFVRVSCVCANTSVRVGQRCLPLQYFTGRYFQMS